MRFGHFFYPMNFDPSRDPQAIDRCLQEAQLVEEMGLDAIWLAEHHFAGEVIYSDSLVFAGAVAAKTKRILIGLGVIEMALHHPVRAAVQTALLDNLSHGRLVVGIGRGSNYNAFEYSGFGTTVAEGRERLTEAEDLLVKAWTSEDLNFQGKYWQVTIPSLRPRPYQKPHPPLARACGSDESIISIAKIGRPPLFRGLAAEKVGRKVKLYRDTMLSAGFSEKEVEKILDQSWVWCDSYIAETNDEALDEFLPAFLKAEKHVQELREKWNPKDQDVPTIAPHLLRSDYKENPDPLAEEMLIGSPKRVAEQVAQFRDAGVRNLMLTQRSLMSLEKTSKSLRLLSEKIMPLFR
jgi:alkanesulfonate monooxygenase SsuD/methylene tetrahydromethanopterin reductase-like flavin-dependent oxidoreductase (luciferase family)